MDETSVQDEVPGEGNEGGAPTVSNTGRESEMGMVSPSLPSLRKLLLLLVYYSFSFVYIPYVSSLSALAIAVQSLYLYIGMTSAFQYFSILAMLLLRFSLRIAIFLPVVYLYNVYYLRRNCRVFSFVVFSISPFLSLVICTIIMFLLILCVHNDPKVLLSMVFASIYKYSRYILSLCVMIAAHFYYVNIRGKSIQDV